MYMYTHTRVKNMYLVYFHRFKVANGFGRGLRDLVNRYNPNVSTNNFPVTLGRDGTGKFSEN